jgi:hypothetical protein
LSTLIERSEGQAISYEDEVQGYDVTYTHREFALGTSVSNKLWEDDLFRVMLRKPANLARAKAATKSAAWLTSSTTALQLAVEVFRLSLPATP